MAKSIQERLKRLEYLYRCLCNSSGGGSQTLAQTLVFGKETGGEDILVNDADSILLENGSSLKKGTYDYGANGGISRICGVGYEDMWQAGVRHVFNSNGYIRHSTNCFEIIPDNTFDSSKRFKYGSLWTLDDGTTYKCIDDTIGAAIWELYSPPAKYKVFTAILTQTGNSSPTLSMDSPLVIGTTYEILDDDSGTVDFTNVGAPNNNIGTFFMATGTTPTSWGVNLLGQLLFDTAAPITTVLENTIGNVWFTYVGAGHYRCSSDNLFTPKKTTIFIGETVNKSNLTDRLQLRVLCAPDHQNQPAYLDIFSGTISVTYEDDVISDPALRFAITFEIRVYN